MPREVLVDKGTVKARVVKFDDDIPDEVEDPRATVERTAEELEWLRFQVRWAKWKKQFHYRAPDPANLQPQIHG